MIMNLKDIAHALRGEVHNNYVLAPGPGHSANDRSLKVSLGGPDGLLVHSFSTDDPINCKDYVRERCGIPAGHKGNGKQWSDVVAEYVYRDAEGRLYLRVQRTADKKFWQHHWTGSEWHKGAPRGPRIPYRLPELIAADPAEPVYIVEGEKDADRLASLGFVVTTTSGGSNGKWTSELNSYFAGRQVRLVPDNDAPGDKYVAGVAAHLHGVAASIRIIDLPGLGPRTANGGKDVSDWLDLGNIPETLVDLGNAAPEWSSLERPRGPRLMSSAAFITGFTPPEYLIDGILQRRFIYAFTGRTGEGKTSVCLRLAAHVSEGVPLGDAAVTRGRVLYLAGENPDDIRMRWILLLEQMGLDENEVMVDFVDGRFKISEIPEHILAAAAKHEYVLVIVDTSVAFSQSLDENDNVEQLRHAQALRNLIDVLPGGPTILVCCHPPKNASDDNLQPRGGGSVIAEFDGNLTCKRTDTVTVVYHQGKFRGPDFTPLHFTLEGQTAGRLKDSHGRQIWSVFAKPASEQDQENISKAIEDDLAAVMAAIRDEPGISIASIATKLGWLNKQRKPDKSKAQRRVKTLENKKWVERDGEQLELTAKGKDRLTKLEARKAKGTAPKGSPDLTLVKS
jgi:AAA domain